MSQLTIRPGELRDLPALTTIYNHYVVETPTTFDIDSYTPEERRSWFDSFASSSRYRLLVAQNDDEVVGYTSSSQFRSKRAYDTSVETTIYLHPDKVGQGWGYTLYHALFELLRHEDLHRCVSGITLPNPGSVALHERCGFKPVGIFQEIGHKHGRFWDVQWFALDLAETADLTAP